MIRRLLALFPLLLLMSCYVPDDFKAELRLSKYGEYDLTFEGRLIYAPIVHDYESGLVKPEEEAARIEDIRQDLVRDPAVKSAVSLGKGVFSVKYERSGKLGPDQLTAILRRDSKILLLKSRPDGQILIAGAGIRPTDAQALAKANVTMRGTFRIVTDANVLKTNAAEIRPFGAYKVYLWTIDNALSPMPKMLILREPEPS